jgi:phage FluMu protein Com
MKFKFKCQCGKILTADSAAAGKKAKCPHCGQIVQIPVATEAAPELQTRSKTQTDSSETKSPNPEPPAPSPAQAPSANPAFVTSTLPEPAPSASSSSVADLAPVPLDDFDVPTGENGSSQVKPAFSDMQFLKGRPETGSSHARPGKALPASSGEKTVQAESGPGEYGLLIEPDEVCPKCGRPMSKQAVLCIECGHNRKTGATVAGVATPTGGKKPPKPVDG